MLSYVFYLGDTFILQSITITRPDDWHVHLRDAEALRHTVMDSAGHFSRALVMPNLKPALTSLTAVCEYRQRILAVLPEGSIFQPLMTFYLNETLSPDDLYDSQTHPYIVGAKLYPKGATTNSAQGVESLKALYPLLEVMQDRALVLQIHAEIATGDIFEREAEFIRQHLPQLIADFPKLRMVIEHVSTRVAVDFVKNCPDTIAATVTPHHLMYNRNQLLGQGLRSHYYCLPILKHSSDQKAIQEVVASGHRKFFAGTDSAPHARADKESCCASAGIYSAPYALAVYAQVLEELHVLEKLNAFTSHFGADFYHQARNQEELVLVKKKQWVPEQLPFGQTTVVPIAAGEALAWSIL